MARAASCAASHKGANCSNTRILLTFGSQTSGQIQGPNNVLRTFIGLQYKWVKQLWLCVALSISALICSEECRDSSSCNQNYVHVFVLFLVKEKNVLIDFIWARVTRRVWTIDFRLLCLVTWLLDKDTYLVLSFNDEVPTWTLKYIFSNTKYML